MALIVVNAIINLRVAGGHGRDDQVSKDNKESTKGDKGKSSKPGGPHWAKKCPTNPRGKVNVIQDEEDSNSNKLA